MSDFIVIGLICRENSHANPPINDQKRKVLLTRYFDFNGKAISFEK